MGNTRSKPALRPEMAHYANSSVQPAHRCHCTVQIQISSLQSGFGFGIGLSTFAQLFRLDANSESTRKLWAAWDTDLNGVTDVLEIMAGLTLISQGTFDAKLTACFTLFDFDSSSTLTLDEIRIGIRTSVAGYCKLIGEIEPTQSEVEKLVAKSFGGATGLGASKSISRTGFLQFVVTTPQVIQTVCRFGTTDAEQVKEKYAQASMEGHAAAKIQSAFKQSKRVSQPTQSSAASTGPAAAASSASAAASSAATARAVPLSPTSHLRHPSSAAGSHMRTPSHGHARIQSHGGSGGSNGPHASNLSPQMVGQEWNIAQVRRARMVFDSMDTDRSGCISIRELITNLHESGRDEFIGGAIHAFQVMDRDGDGRIDFEEMLRVVFPWAHGKDLKSMVKDVGPSAAGIDSGTIRALKNWFDNCDSNCTGRIAMGRAYRILSNDINLKHVLDGYTFPTRHGIEERECSFNELMIEFLSHAFRSAGRMGKLQMWIRGVEGGSSIVSNELDEKQEQELETLFRLFEKERKGNGTGKEGTETEEGGQIDMRELKAHFQGLGFNEDEMRRLFAPYTTDSNSLVDWNHFRQFYQQISRLHSSNPNSSVTPSASASSSVMTPRATAMTAAVSLHSPSHSQASTAKLKTSAHSTQPATAAVAEGIKKAAVKSRRSATQEEMEAAYR